MNSNVAGNREEARYNSFNYAKASFRESIDPELNCKNYSNLFCNGVSRRESVKRLAAGIFN